MIGYGSRTSTTAPSTSGAPDYFRRGLETFGEIMRRRYIRTMPVNIWLDRNFFGLRALLFRLRARVDLGGILRRESAGAPAAAAIGERGA